MRHARHEASSTGERRLEALVGEWRLEALVEGQPMVTGRTTFSWMEGTALLVQRAESDPPGPDTPPEWVANSPFPTTSVFGLDDWTGIYGMLYSDGRGVRRVYQASFADGVWRIWGRPGADFHQRFTAEFSDDGNTVTGYWEGSQDGSTWVKDFDVRYTRLG